MNVLHVSPHPDDELIGAPATLMALRDAGASIVNFACSLGAGQGVRRRQELTEACARAGFELVIAQRPIVSAEARATGAARAVVERRLSDELGRLMSATRFDLVIAPSPHDRHPGHELAGRVARSTLEERDGGARLWLWRLWGETLVPTTVVTFDEARLQEILFALSAHAGELARNDYSDYVRARAVAERVLAAELVFGFGMPGLAATYAETTCEVVWDARRWTLGTPRELDVEHPFPSPSRTDVSWWMHSRSAADRMAAARAQLA